MLVFYVYCDKARNVLKSVFLEQYRNILQRRSTRAVMTEERPWRSQVFYACFLHFIFDVKLIAEAAIAQWWRQWFT